MRRVSGLITGLLAVAISLGLSASAQERACRVEDTPTGAKVVGGVNAHLANWPGIASIQLNMQQGAFHVCGGAAISKDWILTAAHCVEGFKVSEQSGRVFAYEEAGDGGPERKIAAIRIQLGTGDLGRKPDGSPRRVSSCRKRPLPQWRHRSANHVCARPPCRKAIRRDTSP